MSDMDLQKTDQQKQKELKKMEKQKAKEEKKQQKVQKKEQKKASMEPGRKKKIIKRSIFGGVAAVFVLFIIYNNIAAANAKPVVYTMTVAKGDIEQTVNTSGSVVSDEVKTYFAPVSIEVGTIHVAVGESASKVIRIPSRKTMKVLAIWGKPMSTWLCWNSRLRISIITLKICKGRWTTKRQPLPMKAPFYRYP